MLHPASTPRPAATMTAAPAPAELICHQADEVLRLSRGKRRVPLENLGPSPFNRHGEPLSGRHIWSLAERILRRE
eukprot:9175911-Alexandrium_andersonii.AAC.1